MRLESLGNIHLFPQMDAMATFASKGIYIWLDLDTFNTTIQ